jgi:PAT family beta-lactamase induction signal transducer AmpG
LLASSGALVIAARTSWEFVYQLMAFMMAFGIFGCMLVQEKKNTNLVRSNLINSFINPIKDLYKRFGIYALTIIFLIIATYRLTDIVTGQITNVFYVKMGFTLDEIALVVKFIALIAAIFGFYIGTFILKRFNIYNALIIGAVLVMLTNIFFAYIAISEKNLLALSSIVALDSIAAGVVGTINITFLTSLVSKKYTAAQYALLTSIMTLVPKILSGFSGTAIVKFREYIFNDSFILNNMQSTESNSSSVQSIVFSAVAIIERVNDNSWMLFYMSTSLMTIPSILLLYYYSKKYRV